MALTMPQILMLNHAAHVNKQRQDIRLDNNKDSDSLHDRIESGVNGPVWNGKRFEDLTSDEMEAYYAS